MTNVAWEGNNVNVTDTTNQFLIGLKPTPQDGARA